MKSQLTFFVGFENICSKNRNCLRMLDLTIWVTQKLVCHSHELKTGNSSSHLVFLCQPICLVMRHLPSDWLLSENPTTPPPASLSAASKSTLLLQNFSPAHLPAAPFSNDAQLSQLSSFRRSIARQLPNRSLLARHSLRSFWNSSCLVCLYTQRNNCILVWKRNKHLDFCNI